MARKKDDELNFDIKRAYEKWLDAGQPISAGEPEMRQKRSRRQEEKPVKRSSIRSKTEKSSAGRRTEKPSAGRRTEREGNGYPRIPKVDPNSDFPKCPVHKKCGGCSMIGLDYKWTLEYKKKYVEKLLRPFVKLNGIEGMEDPYHYRNKVNAAFAYVKDGRGERNICGIYEQGTHKVVPVRECLLEDRQADAIIQDILKMTYEFKIKIYDEDSGYGLLRHVMVRIGHVTGQVMVVLVLASPILPNKNAFVEKLLKNHPEITTILISVNDGQTSMVLGKREIVLYGEGYIEDRLCGNTFRISPKSFYQVNSVQTERMYRQAVKYANLTGRERVVDAYCGIGTIGITAASKAKEVIGIELNGDAVKDAIKNARANNIRNISFYENDAGIFLKGMAKEHEMCEVVFMDPPRSGSTEEFMQAAVDMRPGRIIYISCEPKTLARDLCWLKKHGYKAREAVAYDMFPFTEHVETVCLLSKLSEEKNHISVKVDMDEMDVTAAESKATYQEIQEWVQEKYRFHVTHLNIAKTKRKCGIIERVNYNLPKSENSRSPETPKEKEEAIIEAFRHFQMI